MKNLISIAEHSDWLFEQHFRIDEKWDLHRLRVAFGKQPLELWQFVPCDEDGNVLEEPTPEDGLYDNDVYKKYQQAKERCLFDGFECQKKGGEYLVKFENKPVWVNWNNSKTIEDLIYLKPKLTQTAIKQIGLWKI